MNNKNVATGNTHTLKYTLKMEARAICAYICGHAKTQILNSQTCLHMICAKLLYSVCLELFVSHFITFVLQNLNLFSY